MKSRSCTIWGPSSAGGPPEATLGAPGGLISVNGLVTFSGHDGSWLETRMANAAENCGHSRLGGRDFELTLPLDRFRRTL